MQMNKSDMSREEIELFLEEVFNAPYKEITYEDVERYLEELGALDQRLALFVWFETEAEEKELTWSDVFNVLRHLKRQETEITSEAIILELNCM